MAPTIRQPVLPGENSGWGPHAVAVVVELLKRELAVALIADVENSHVLVPRARGHVLCAVLSPKRNKKISKNGRGEKNHKSKSKNEKGGGEEGGRRDDAVRTVISWHEEDSFEGMGIIGNWVKSIRVGGAHKGYCHGIPLSPLSLSRRYCYCYCLSWKRKIFPPSQKHLERQGSANMIPTRVSGQE